MQKAELSWQGSDINPDGFVIYAIACDILSKQYDIFCYRKMFRNCVGYYKASLLTDRRQTTAGTTHHHAKGVVPLPILSATKQGG